jgi:zinc/manganese transport system substrate-binding protein
MKTIRFLLAGAAFLASQAAFADLKIVTTTADLASIAKAIGGSKASVSSLITGARDPHRLEAKPSFMSRISGASLFIAVGLGLEIGYERAILSGSANRRVSIGAAGNLHVGDYCYILEKPAGGASRAMGDIHPEGNPHVWLDPYNGRLIAKAIEERMSSIDAGNAKVYQQNLESFLDRLDSAMFGKAAVGKHGAQRLWEWSNAGTLAGKSDVGGWAAQMALLSGKPIITYHRSWSYLARRFGLKVIEELEPKPGLEPTPGHLAEVVRVGNQQGAKIILQEPYFSRRSSDFVAGRISASVVVAPLSVGQDPAAKDYIGLFDTIIAKLKAAS